MEFGNVRIIVADPPAVVVPLKTIVSATKSLTDRQALKPCNRITKTNPDNA
jgi:hypothetical protein